MYEASEVIAIGEAHDLILGIKPPAQTPDSDPAPFSLERVDDIDETDE